MSTGLWARDGSGVNRKLSKIYMANGGTNCKLKSLWARDNSGVNRKIFSGAITWSWSLMPWNEADWGSHTTGGNSDVYSAFFHHPEVDGRASNIGCQVIYTFSTSLLMHAGQTLTIWGDGSANDYGLAITVNNNTVWLFEPDRTPFSGQHTFTTDTQISAIGADLACSPDTQYSAYMVATVTVNSDAGSFLLNNSGSFEPQ